MTKQDISKEYCLKFPDTPNRTLAKLLLKDHPTVFITLEMARRAIRYSRGANGESHRKRVAPTEATKPLGWQKNLLPKTANKKREPLVIKGNHRILVLSGIHVPYHDTNAVETAIEYGKQIKPTVILLNGDIGDFYAISRFQKDPRKRDLASEVYMARNFLYTLRRLFPTQAIYFKAGNHDIRWDHYLINNASDLVGIEEFSLQSILHLDKLNITFIPDKQLVRMGRLVALHGHEFGSSMFSPVNIARGLYLRAKDNAICGHHHQTSEHTEPNINGRVTTCWSVACLCELHPDYMPINKFTHGFAHVKVFDNEDFEVTNYRIVDGKIK